MAARAGFRKILARQDIDGIHASHDAWISAARVVPMRARPRIGASQAALPIAVPLGLLNRADQVIA